MNSFFQKRVSFVNRVRRSVALYTAHFLRFILRLFGRKASSFPGAVALKIYRRFLSDACFGREVVIVTGTNGKTTTAHVLSEMMKAGGRVVVSNHSGANMEDGLVSSLCEQWQELTCEDPLLIFEIDEAWLSRLSSKIKPACILVLNLFRDQLDRYGELNRTRELIREGIDASSQECRLVLNADDPLVVSLALDSKKQSLFFGVHSQAMDEVNDSNSHPHLSDSDRCPDCFAPLRYSHRIYAHLGEYTCSKCQFRRPDPDLTFMPLHKEDDSNAAIYASAEQSREAGSGISGQHNLYNISAALLCALDHGVDLETALSVLPGLKPTSGRMEELELGPEQKATMILIKNPIALEQALKHAKKAADAARILISVNDLENDGRDLSWIWDVDFEGILYGFAPELKEIVCSGRRANELALRLHYAGWPEDRLKVAPDSAEALTHLRNNMQAGEKVYLLPNYTAMLSLQDQLQLNKG